MIYEALPQELHSQGQPNLVTKITYRTEITMLTLNLDDEAEKYLIEILSQEKTTSQELVKKLLRKHLTTLKPPQTVLERLGGIPEELLESTPDLSDRDTRKQKISEYLARKHQQREQ